MPEGDTIAKLAAALGPLLQGAVLARVEVRGSPVAELAGRRVEGVHAVGKHLFVELEGGLLLRSHLGMHGSWHRYGRGEPWQRPAHQASLVLDLGDRVLVCFNAREVEVLAAGGLRHRDLLARLGPSLVEPGNPSLAAVARARSGLGPETALVDVLLDQRVASGIGNVYKSEVLFLEGLHPLQTLGDTGDEQMAALFARASDLLRRNLGGGPRVTRFDQRPGGPLWVYGRRSRPCLRCGTAIRYARLGLTQRSTYWCPRCQPPIAGKPAPRGGSTPVGADLPAIGPSRAATAYRRILGSVAVVSISALRVVELVDSHQALDFVLTMSNIPEPDHKVLRRPRPTGACPGSRGASCRQIGWRPGVSRPLAPGTGAPLGMVSLTGRAGMT